MPHGSKGIVVDILELSRENGDELKAGVNKSIRVLVAEKRKITVGDKMSGRHGNKRGCFKSITCRRYAILRRWNTLRRCIKPSRSTISYEYRTSTRSTLRYGNENFKWWNLHIYTSI